MMSSRPLLTRRRAIAQCATVAVTALMCAGLLSAAVLVPAPRPLLPIFVVVCIGCAMAAAYELPAAVARLAGGRGGRSWDAKALARLRRQLAELPETRHPLDL